MRWSLRPLVAPTVHLHLCTSIRVRASLPVCGNRIQLKLSIHVGVRTQLAQPQRETATEQLHKRPDVMQQLAAELAKRHGAGEGTVGAQGSASSGTAATIHAEEMALNRLGDVDAVATRNSSPPFSLVQPDSLTAMTGKNSRKLRGRVEFYPR